MGLDFCCTFPAPSHLWHDAHCTRNIVTTQLQYCFVNYFQNIFGTMAQYSFAVKFNKAGQEVCAPHMAVLVSKIHYELCSGDWGNICAL